jgi:hypothetical protein
MCAAGQIREVMAMACPPSGPSPVQAQYWWCYEMLGGASAPIGFPGSLLHLNCLKWVTEAGFHKWQAPCLRLVARHGQVERMKGGKAAIVMTLNSRMQGS